jgi:hypothetical protein
VTVQRAVAARSTEGRRRYREQAKVLDAEATIAQGQICRWGNDTLRVIKKNSGFSENGHQIAM